MWLWIENCFRVGVHLYIGGGLIVCGHRHNIVYGWKENVAVFDVSSAALLHFLLQDNPATDIIYNKNVWILVRSLNKYKIYWKHRIEYNQTKRKTDCSTHVLPLLQCLLYTKTAVKPTKMFKSNLFQLHHRFKRFRFHSNADAKIRALQEMCYCEKKIRQTDTTNTKRKRLSVRKKGIEKHIE